MKDKDLMLFVRVQAWPLVEVCKHNEEEEATLHVFKKNRTHMLVMYSSVYIYHKTSSDTCF